MAEKVEARHERILRLVREAGSIRITELAAQLGVSLETARRDVNALADIGRVRRVHGSVSWPSLPLNARDARLTRQPPVAQPTGLTLGMVVPTAGYYFQGIIRGARAVAAAAGARLIVGISEYRDTQDVVLINDMIKAGVDGLLLSPSWRTHEPDERHCALIAGLDVPVVMVERRIPLGFPGAGLDRVCSDHAAGATLAVEHLARLGHSSVALVGRSTPTMTDIRRGFEAAVSVCGAEGYDLITARLDLGEWDTVERDTDRLLELVGSGRVRAALVHTDTDAINLLRKLAAHGATVPGDFAMVSYDDELTLLADVPLTAVAPAKAAIGETAARLVLRRIADPAARRTHTELLPELRVRESCGAGPVGNCREND